MERAGIAIADWIERLQHEHKLAKIATLLAGLGNNAGDGFVALRELKKRGFQVFATDALDGKRAPLAAKKEQEFIEAGGVFVDTIPASSILLDGVFGVGFHGPLSKSLQKIFKDTNSSGRFIVSIDVPSGLDSTTGDAEGAIKADVTLAIELPKLGFFLQDGWNYVGELHCLPIGLDASTIETECVWLEANDLKLPERARNCNKYTAGHVVGIAGSPGMAGAAMLASEAALKSGAGIVHLLHPESLSSEFFGPPWEIVRRPIKNSKTTKELIQKASHCFVGPGLGEEADTLLKSIWNECKDKSVLDADCLNWLSRQKGSIGPLPEAILTPHMGEMLRLLKLKKKEPLTLKFLQKCQAFAVKNTTNLLLKGAPSFLFAKGEPIVIMSRGDPGMATAGAGDVLTGILASLRAQGLSSIEALRTGTYLHGLAGEIAAKHETSQCLTASSLINYLPAAFFLLQRILK